jgi:site-specific recombinase XerD
LRPLKEFFKSDRLIQTITAGDAEDFKRWLTSNARCHSRERISKPGLASATVAKRLQGSVTIFNYAVKREMIEKNPFVDIKQPKNTNPERQMYIEVSKIETLIENANSTEWKLLLALSRYLGVRVPSEPFSMTWDCVNWEKKRLPKN